MTDRLRVMVLADTHLAPGSSRRLPDAVYWHLGQADVILHAGDLVAAEVLDDLGRFAPVHAVLGDNDHGLDDTLPETIEVTLAGVDVAMIHNSGPSKGRAARMKRRFPSARVVVFGHSHVPCDETGADGQRLFNPGSATWKRRAPRQTIGTWDVADGELVAHRLVPVD